MSFCLFTQAQPVNEQILEDFVRVESIKDTFDPYVKQIQCIGYTTFTDYYRHMKNIIGTSDNVSDLLDKTGHFFENNSECMQYALYENKETIAAASFLSLITYFLYKAANRKHECNHCASCQKE
jgi:hypothetical protein